MALDCPHNEESREGWRIGFAGASNLRVDGMRVEVCIPVLLTGLAFLSLAIWWRSR